MLERKHKGVLSLNLKKLASRFDDLKIILILQNEMLLLMLFCKRVLKQREDIPRYGNTINNFFWGQYALIFSVKIAYLKIFLCTYPLNQFDKNFSLTHLLGN